LRLAAAGAVSHAGFSHFSHFSHFSYISQEKFNHFRHALLDNVLHAFAPVICPAKASGGAHPAVLRIESDPIRA